MVKSVKIKKVVTRSRRGVYMGGNIFITVMAQ